MYATRDDLITRFGQTQIMQVEGFDGQQKTEQALADAGNIIDSYLSARYHIPLTNSPALEIHCSNIARYLLFPNDPHGEVTLRYKDALEWLKMVAKGQASVMFNDPIDASNDPVSVGNSYPGKVFGDEVFASMPSVGD